MDLLIIVALSLVVVPLALLASGPLRIALGLLFIIFFPGYMLIAALFPRKSALDGIERLALSFGLSIAIVPLIGLALNYTPWGIRLEPILFSLLGFILVMAAVALWRRHTLPVEGRFEVHFMASFSQMALGWSNQGRRDRLLTMLLVITIVGAIGILAYVIQSPSEGEKFTEFYILGPGGKMEDYPQRLILGEEGTVILGVINSEHETTAYKVEITIEGDRVAEVEPFSLDHEGKWEQEVSFAPVRAGLDQKVEFLLYKGEGTELYRTLNLWVDVEETS